MLREKILFKVYVPETIIQIRIICRFLWLYNLSYGTLQNKDTIWGFSGWMFNRFNMWKTYEQGDEMCRPILSRICMAHGKT